MSEITDFNIADPQALAMGGGFSAVGLLVIYGAVVSVPEEIVFGGEWSLRLSLGVIVLALGVLIVGYYYLREMTIDLDRVSPRVPSKANWLIVLFRYWIEFVQSLEIGFAEHVPATVTCPVGPCPCFCRCVEAVAGHVSAAFDFDYTQCHECINGFLTTNLMR